MTRARKSTQSTAPATSTAMHTGTGIHTAFQSTTNNTAANASLRLSQPPSKQTLDRVARRVVLEQEFPDARTALQRATASLRDTATSSTTSTHLTGTRNCCSCAHIRHFLPIELSLDLCAAATGGWMLKDPVHALHLASQEERWTGRDAPALYGEEQERMQALQVAGFTEQWIPQTAEEDWKQLHMQERKAARERAEIKARAAANLLEAEKEKEAKKQRELQQQQIQHQMQQQVILEKQVNDRKEDSNVQQETGQTTPMNLEEGTVSVRGNTDATGATGASVALKEQCDMENPNDKHEPSSNDTDTAIHASTDEQSPKDSVEAKDSQDTPQEEHQKQASRSSEPTLANTESKQESTTTPLMESATGDGSVDNKNDSSKSNEMQQTVASHRASPVPSQALTALASAHSTHSKTNTTTAVTTTTGDKEDITTAEPEAMDVDDLVGKNDAKEEESPMASPAKVESNPDQGLAQPVVAGEDTKSILANDISSNTIEEAQGGAERSTDQMGTDSATKAVDRTTEGKASKSVVATNTTTAGETSDKVDSPVTSSATGGQQQSGTSPTPAPTIVKSTGPSSDTAPPSEKAEAATPSRIDDSPPVDLPNLDETRFWSLQSKEGHIDQIRKHFLSKRSAAATTTTTTTKKSKSSATSSKKRKSSIAEHKSTPLSHLTAWREHGDKHVKLTLTEENNWYSQQRNAIEQVQVWLENFSWSRQLYWKEHFPDKTHVKATGFGGMKRATRTCSICTNPPSDAWFAPSPSVPCTGDDLMRCLECSFTGCAPITKSGETSNHIWQHHLESNHKLAVTCGSRADVYCFSCADFSYHPVFDQERERIDLHHHLPWLAWKEYPLQRSFDAFRFVEVPEFGVVWQGMRATYPSVVPAEHVRGARSCRWRQILFQGELELLPSTAPKSVVEFAVRQNRLSRKNRFKISAPVGMYNLGNTCFQSAVLQCLIACTPVQRFFLGNVMHHHVACHELRKAEGPTARIIATGSNKSPEGKTVEVCLSCELDKLILRYFGSSRGVDVLSAVTDDEISANGMSEIKPGIRGDPLITSDMLSCAWNCGGMSHLAGYDQRDAHEFLHGFLDSLSKSDHAYRNRITRAVSLAQPPKTPGTSAKAPSSYRGIVNTLFEGTFRSVLICQECGNKRSQTESFMSISLPLSKEVYRSTTQGKGNQGNKLTVERCFHQFTMPETLADPVDCPSCAKKTPTKKQHVISRLPHVLCLHLKRFDASLNKKIEEFVSFPEKGLNMGTYLPHWAEVPRVSVVKEKEEGRSQLDGFEPEISYDLCGTVNHHGSMQSGHYVANIQVGDEWFHCNDAHISHAKAKDVLESEGAYLLFYIRK